ncbi:VOC family protein [Loktanella sp. SALINAS62]|uniref:VOC family protein n=1 Tax=Loktanella sp. SALINAS62 TaxID=2706124 RepID=UPI001B8B6133|nr:VOC family protein [Loktanella sp. SALINAS62]MBS1303957.1 hypothetical protein [Loktanella sp. SALINAS62]
MRQIFVNLPVTDLNRSRAFYEALGFTINPQFSDKTGNCVVVSDTICLMILTHAKFAAFSPRPIADSHAQTASLVALSCDSRAEVEAMTNAATAHGGTDNGTTQDMPDFMYGRSFSDPDGHVFEPFWMNPVAVDAQPA